MAPFIRGFLVFLVFQQPSSVTAQSGGSSGCPCVEWPGLDNYVDGSCLNYTPSGGMEDALSSSSSTSNSNSYCYPIDYGAGICKTWDLTMQPFCADSSGDALPSAPAWCFDQFCYVDPNNCDKIIGHSGMFPTEDLYYSYGVS